MGAFRGSFVYIIILIHLWVVNVIIIRLLAESLESLGGRGGWVVKDGAY